MPKRKGKGIAIMITFRADDLALVDEWAEWIERLPRAVAIKRAALAAAEAALRARADNAQTAAALAGG